MKGARLLLLSLFLVHCAREVVVLEASPVDDAPALIFVAVYPDRIVAQAMDAGGSAAEIQLVAPETSVELYAVVLERPLASLGLTAGEVPLAVEGRRSWPAFSRVYASSFSEGRQSSWTARDVLPPSLRALRFDLQPLSACDVGPVGFEISSFELDTKSNVNWGARLDDRTALIATGDHRFYRATPEGVSEVDLAQPPGLGPMLQQDDGTIYVVSASGTWRGSPSDLVFERIADGPVDRYIFRIDGPTDPNVPFELFSIGPRGQVAHFDGAVWTEIGPAVAVDLNADVLWLGPGRAAAVRETVAYVQWIDGMSSTTEAPFEGSLQGLTEVTRFGDYELVLGTRDGHVLTKRGGAWDDLDDPLFDRVFVVYPEGDSFLAAGVGGIVARYTDGYGFCSQMLAPSHVHHLLPLAGGYLVLMSNRDTWDSAGGEPRFVTPVSWLFPL